MYAHVDINNCYVSCETVFRPELKGQPVVVLSNNDGCVVARSDEAKLLGIKMASPEYLVRDILKKNNAYTFSSNYALYADMSARVMNNLSRFTPTLEVYSIDEAFLSLHHLQDEIRLKPENDHDKYIRDYARNISDKIQKYTGLPITVGVGLTKSVAKLANKYAKRNKASVVVLDTPEKVEKATRDISVEDIWGIGRSYYKKLESENIKTARQFMEKNPGWVKQNMTIQGLRLWKELWGQDCYGITEIVDRKKAMCSSRSFNTFINDLNQLSEAVASYTATVAIKLRKDKSIAQNLSVFLCTNRHRKQHFQYFPSLTKRLPSASNNTAYLTGIALESLRDIFKRDIDIKKCKFIKAGVIVTGLIPESEMQYNLFETYNAESSNQLSKITDKINNRYGKGTIRLAVEGYEKEWKMKQDFLSPCYTTRWTDIIKSD